ncbi:ShlB/FhaC/HecB family hemolysin secretion/activation protein [Peristeroidobacter soli]|uniref:ShlB/FhaC/HecB family hemolysin secretion/activation protein n=1 Tax=Peristeroidobacter soli TaxID=2497877 RepID=UPI00101BA190|nr:ShlB/FhaC/HecB family hemolysin secretion/activation protein [Peristeroidobacter soli]
MRRSHGARQRAIPRTNIQETTLLNRSIRLRRAVRYLVMVPAVCGLSSVTWAQSIPLPAPTAGSVLREIQAQPAASSQDLGAPNLIIPKAEQTTAAGGPKIDVRQYQLKGESAADAQSLQPLLAPFVGAGKTLADLEAAAKAVETELRHRGRFLAQVIVPAQRMVDGVVELQVFEGRLGEVSIDVQPDANISRSLVDSTVEPLRGNPPIERDLIDGALLRLGDLRGIAVHSVLKPGDEPGIADLAIDINRGRRYATEFEYDNGGSVYTGRDRFYANLDVFDLAGRGDVASLQAQASTGTRYIQGSWLVPVNGLGTRIGPVAGWLDYELGTPQFEPLDARGNAYWFALQLQQPLIRSQDHNLYLQASLGERRFEDEVRALGIDSHKSVDGYGSIGLAGQVRDSYRGLNNYSFSVASGKLGFDDAADAAFDAQSYRTAGRYTLYSVALSRLQTITSRDSLLLATQAQLPSRNLDSSEKFTLGGMSAVRGYPATDSPSDQAITLTWEYRRLLGFALDGRWSASLFGDYGFGRLHDEPLPTDPDNTRDIHSHGIGLDYGSDMGLSIRGFVAWRGNEPAQTDDRSARLFVQASMAF